MKVGMCQPGDHIEQDVEGQKSQRSNHDPAARGGYASAAQHRILHSHSSESDNLMLLGKVIAWVGDTRGLALGPIQPIPATEH